MKKSICAEPDAKAREEYEPYLWYFMKKLLLLPPELGFPPGYITPRSYQNVVASFTRRNDMGTQNTWEDLMDGRFILAGSPATVREQLLFILKELGTGSDTVPVPDRLNATRASAQEHESLCD